MTSAACLHQCVDQESTNNKKVSQSPSARSSPPECGPFCIRELAIAWEAESGRPHLFSYGYCPIVSLAVPFNFREGQGTEEKKYILAAGR